MYKVIRLTTNTPSTEELQKALNDGYSLVNVSETHSGNYGFIIYILKRG